MLKKTGIVAGAIFVFLLIVCGAVMMVKTPVPVEYYMLDQCGGCSVTDHPCNICSGERQERITIEEMLESAGVKNQVDFKLYNVLYSFYKDKLAQVLQTEIVPQDMEYPVVLVGNTLLLGKGEIEKKFISSIQKEGTFLKKLERIFRKDSISWKDGKMIPNIVFFTMNGCKDCEEAKEWLKELDSRLNGELLKEFSYCEVGEEENNWEMLKKVYILYGREQESLWVPTIVVNGQCLIGMDEIAEFFNQYVPGGEIRTEVPQDYE